jgi:excisionase family DNA binding protein
MFKKLNKHQWGYFMKLSLSIEEVRQATGIGRTKIYEAINSGKLPARKFGKRTVVLKDDLDAFLDSLQPYSI